MESNKATVDLTLLDMATQKDIDVGGTFDYFGSLSWAENTENITQEHASNRKMPRDMMISHGFHPLDEEWWHFTLDNEPYPDTYFPFQVNSHQVKKPVDFSVKLKNDEEFHLRFFDFMVDMNQKSREIIEKAAKEVVLQSQAQLKDFAEEENVVLDEDRITDAVNKSMHYIRLLDLLTFYSFYSFTILGAL